MIYYLTHGFNTVIAAHASEFDLTVTVSLSAFAKLVLETPKSRLQELVENFEEIQDLRGAWFGTPELEEQSSDHFLCQRFQELAETWSLNYRCEHT